MLGALTVQVPLANKLMSRAEVNVPMGLDDPFSAPTLYLLEPTRVLRREVAGG